MTHIISTRATVKGVHEHSRTIMGRRDPLTGGATTESISLGWFIHLDFGPESGPLSFGVGPERPTQVSLGDEVILTIYKSSPVKGG